MIKAIHIDDEIKALENFQLLSDDFFPELKIIGQAQTAIQGIKLINQMKPDVVFLDISMPGGGGFEILDALGTIDFEIVFLTAYHQYAIQAIEKNALAYLLKPMDIDAIQNTIVKIKTKLQTKNKNESVSPLGNRLFISINEGFEIIDYNKIIQIQANSNYSVIHLIDGSTKLISKTLKDLESKLDTKAFFRCHRSHIINYSYIKKINTKAGNTLELTNDIQIPLSESNKAFLLKLLNDK